MSRRDKPRDGFFTKVVVATIVVIWVSLVGGNWLGQYIVEQGYIGGEARAVEFKEMPSPRPRPWVTVDPEIQEGLERHIQRQETTDKPAPPRPAAVMMATPVPETARADRVVPARETPRAPGAPAAPAPAEPEAPQPTPAVAIEAPAPRATPEQAAAEDGTYSLQFGSFGSEENARRLAEQLDRAGQSARVEEIDTANGKIYRVRGGTYNREADAQGQAENLKEQGIEAFVVNP